MVCAIAPTTKRAIAAREVIVGFIVENVYRTMRATSNAVRKARKVVQGRKVDATNEGTFIAADLAAV